MNHKNKVYCHVSECAYHTQEDKCDAEGIIINGMYDARTSENTMCQTFSNDSNIH